MLRPPALSTAKRLVLALLMFVLLMVAGAGLALWRQHRLADAFDELTLKDLKRTSLVTEISEGANDAARRLLVLVAAPRDARVDAYAEIDLANRRLDDAMGELAGLLDGGTSHIGYRQVQYTLARYRESFIVMADLVEADDVKAAEELLVTHTDAALNELLDAVKILDIVGRYDLDMRLATFREDMAADRWRLMVLALLAVVVGMVIVLWVSRRLLTPLVGAAAHARRYAAGDFSQRLPVQRADEVGEMASALNHLADEVSAREQQLRRMIGIDALTGLSQRNRFLADIAAALAPAQRGRRLVALVCFDVDRLKSINGLLGFDAGDAVIQQAAARAQALVKEPGRTCRLAGGTFAMLAELDGATGDTELDAMRRHLEQPVAWQGQPLDLSVTLGVALCPLHGHDPESLLRRAEQALYEGKRQRVGITHYVVGIEAARLLHLSLLTELQQAIEQGQLVPFLQPKLCLRSGEVVCAEALVRWKHPSRGWVQPGDFIPFAERTGRIALITQAMLQQCVALAGQSARRGRVQRLAVNLSTYDLRDPGLPARIAGLLQAQGLPVDRLQVEITESGLLDSGDEPIMRLQALRKIGIKLAIDDFGTGQSSLAYLQRLPAQELKIDRSFVRGVDAEPARGELLAAIVRLGHSLGLVVTAEGVETAGELAVLREVGCDQAQGYLIARPMPAADFDQWQDAHSAARWAAEPALLG